MNGIFFAYQTGKSGSEVVFLLPQIIGFQIVQAVLQVLFHHDPGALDIVLAESIQQNAVVVDAAIIARGKNQHLAQIGPALEVLLSLITWSDSNMAGCSFGGSKQQPFTLAGPHMSNVLSFEDPTAPLTVGTIDEFIEYYLEHHKEARVDYVHDEPAVRALCKKGAVAFLMPPFAKSDLFKGVVMGGVLPRKTFSMGHAEEKRYYVECRKITE